MDLESGTDPSCVVDHKYIRSGKSDIRPILWGLLVGAIQAASTVALRWLEPATLHALYIAFIAAVYIGFAVADGRPRVIAVESSVAAAFLVLAAVGVTGSAWLLVAGYAAHGVKDLWQHRTRVRHRHSMVAPVLRHDRLPRRGDSRRRRSSSECPCTDRSRPTSTLSRTNSICEAKLDARQFAEH